MINRSTFTGIAACLFGAGLIALFVVLYDQSLRGGPLLWIAGLLLVGAIACWFAAAQAGPGESGAEG